MTTEAAPSTPD